MDTWAETFMAQRNFLLGLCTKVGALPLQVFSNFHHYAIDEATLRITFWLLKQEMNPALFEIGNPIDTLKIAINLLEGIKKVTITSTDLLRFRFEVDATLPRGTPRTLSFSEK